jgi:hypothetical protein
MIRLNARHDHVLTRKPQTFLANYSIAARVPYSPVDHHPNFTSASLVAVHGGIHPSWANVTRINEVGHSFVDRLVNRRALEAEMLPRDTPEEERDLYSATGPLWYRGYALDSEASGICEQADDVLKAVGSTRMLMGHTPQFKGILPRCRSKIIIIDTGISSAYGGVLSALEVVYSLTPIVNEDLPDQPVRRVTEREVVTAIYESSTKVIARKERVVEV